MEAKRLAKENTVENDAIKVYKIYKDDYNRAIDENSM
jgi:hypothetical protein